MKKLIGIYTSPRGHWVGDGFPVRTLFSYDNLGKHISPFLLLDHAGPADFTPTTERRGVGQHPHRGFETVTIVYDGEVEHRDSTGAGGTIGPGDVQWMTAARGIIHEEFHSEAFARKGGALEMVQLWVNLKFADYLLIPYVPGAGELIVFCGALIGAGLGFLWFNTYPAQVFMGDVGALALGAALGTIAVIVRQEIVLFIMGGVFVMETLSVVIQVASFKLTGKRVFRMAPIHHHFELKGWPEPRVIVRFWIITVILVLIGLATLKLR